MKKQRPVCWSLGINFNHSIEDTSNAPLIQYVRTILTDDPDNNKETQNISNLINVASQSSAFQTSIRKCLGICDAFAIDTSPRHRPRRRPSNWNTFMSWFRYYERLCLRKRASIRERKRARFHSSISWNCGIICHGPAHEQFTRHTLHVQHSIIIILQSYVPAFETFLI